MQYWGSPFSNTSHIVQSFFSRISIALIIIQFDGIFHKSVLGPISKDIFGSLIIWACKNFIFSTIRAADSLELSVFIFWFSWVEVFFFWPRGDAAMWKIAQNKTLNIVLYPNQIRPLIRCTSDFLNYAGRKKKMWNSIRRVFFQGNFFIWITPNSR